MIEKIIFNLLAFSLFILIFFKLIRKNDTSYLYILGIQFIGIGINFLEFILPVRLNLFFRILIYLCSIVLPIIILWIEQYRGIKFSEMLHIAITKGLLEVGKNEEAKKQMMVLLHKYPNSDKGHEILAEIYEKEGKLFDAIHEYERAIEANEKDFSLYYKIGNLYAGVNRKEEATIMLQELLAKKPEYYQASMLLRRYLLSRGKI